MKRLFYLSATFFALNITLAVAQTANDDCAIAQDLGTISAPPCPIGVNTPVFSNPVVFSNLTNVGALPSDPYPHPNGCNGGVPTNPAADVWYSIVVSGTSLIASINSASLVSPTVVLWEGSCGNLIGRGCAVGAAGAVSATFDGLTDGALYYIQVSGGTLQDQGLFDLSLRAGQVCEPCAGVTSLTVTPLPGPDGTYPPNTTVTFSLRVDGWNKRGNTNWFSGLEFPTIGSGWDLNSIVVTPPSSCDQLGQWSFDPNGFVAGGNNFGAGFYYDSQFPNPVGQPLDGDFSNNSGDGASCDEPAYCNYVLVNCCAVPVCGDATSSSNLWSFEWTMNTNPCPPTPDGADLSLVMNTLTDVEIFNGGGVSVCDDDVVVTFNAAISCCQAPSVAAFDIACFGQVDGRVEVTPDLAGAAPYTYEVFLFSDYLSGGAALQTVVDPNPTTISGLAAGDYIVRVTNADNCARTATFKINQPATAVTVTTTQVDVTCFGGATGTATATPADGAGGYTFLWSPGGQATASIIGLTAGVYGVTVTDANACTVSASVTILEPAQPVANIAATNVTCFGLNNGTVSASLANGQGGAISFLWNDGVVFQTRNNLTPGTYSVTITESGTNGQGQSYSCTASASATIVQPPVLSVCLTAQDSVNCNGGSDGTASVTACGGTLPYSYLWPDGQTTQTASGFSAGTYCVTVTDGAGCTVVECIDVYEPAGISFGLDELNPLCNGQATGSICIQSLIGGTPNYAYIWSNGVTDLCITNVTAGNYCVTVTDANGCTALGCTVLANPPTLTASIPPQNVVNATCNGTCDGQLTVNVGGGAGGYSYLWNTVPAQTTPQATGLCAGVAYVVTVTDASGCTNTATRQISQPQAISVSLAKLSYNGADVSCFGSTNGGINTTVSGGAGAPFGFVWSNAAITQNLVGLASGTYSVTVNDAAGCTTSATATLSDPVAVAVSSTVAATIACFGQSTGSVSAAGSGGTGGLNYTWAPAPAANGPIQAGLPANTYTITVTDLNACTASSSVLLTEPTQLVASFVIDANAQCFGDCNGQATISANGGTAPYTYLWSNGQTGNVGTGLCAGSFDVTITDAAGCSITVGPIVITEPAQLTVSAAVTSNYNGREISCFGASDGEVTAIAVGGSPAYTYTWTNGGNTSIINGLPAGNYCVTVTDFAGCTASSCAAPANPPQLTVSVAVSAQPQCFGDCTGIIDATPAGGTPTYTYLWTPTGQATATATGLCDGNYTVLLTDINGCTASASDNIVEPAALNIVLAVTNPISCFGAFDGALSATVTGGTGNYTYAWSPAGNGANPSGLGAGTYTVTVTDNGICTATATINLTEPTQLTAAFTIDAQPLCFGDCTGQVTLTVSGGTPNYTYGWNNGDNTVVVASLCAGVYSVTVTDANGCTVDANNIVIVEPTQVVVAAAVSSNYNGSEVSCFGSADGEVTATASGGTGALTYLWNDGNAQTTAVATGLVAGTYTVTVTDLNGCTATASDTVDEPTPVVADAGVNITVSVGALATLGGAPTGSGGTAPYTYLWDNGSVLPDPSLNFPTAGQFTFTVTVTDANGCSSSDIIVVNVSCAPIYVVSSFTENTMCQQGDGHITINVGNDNAAYNYVWSGGTQIAPVGNGITDLAAGVYTVTITDPASGCSSVETYAVGTADANFIGALTATATQCGTNTGTATVTVNGGVAPVSVLWDNGDIALTAVNLSAGIHSVTVTDATGCSDVGTVLVPGTAGFTLSTSGVTAANCGIADGAATITINGPFNPPATYVWSDNGNLNVNTRADLAAGTYTVMATDATGCAAELTFTIENIAVPASTVTIDNTTNETCAGAENGAFTITVNYTGGNLPLDTIVTDGIAIYTNGSLPGGDYCIEIHDALGCVVATACGTILSAPSLDVVVDEVEPLCFGGNNGAATATVTGAFGNITYIWDGLAGAATNASLTAGAHTLLVADGRGCLVTGDFSINQPPVLNVNITLDAPILCNAACTGQLTVVAAGGTPDALGNYSILWSNGETTATVTGLCAGTYGVTVTDANGCSANTTFGINEPSAITASYTSVDATCNALANASIDLTVNGGVAPYTFLWSNADTLEDLTAVLAGTYFVTITDANGCTFALTAQVGEPTGLSLVFDAVQNVSCFGGNDGAISITVSGGTPQYFYTWLTPDSLIFIDEDLVNGNAGDYYVTVTDNNGCTASFTNSLTEPTEIVVAVTTIDPTCNQQNGVGNGQMTVVATGGNPGYSYQWTPNANAGNSPTVAGLFAGSYGCTITDNNGCTALAYAVLVEPAPITYVIHDVIPILCFGQNTGRASVDAAGSNGGPFNFQWTSGETDLNTFTSNAVQLAPGNNTVTITEVNTGCFETVTVFISSPASPIAVSATFTNPRCVGDSTGSATATAAGASPPYNFWWVDVNSDTLQVNLAQTSSTLNGLPAGTYTVFTTDGNGCPGIPQVVVLTDPAPFTIDSIGLGGVRCFGGETGTASVVVTSGGSPALVAWSTGTYGLSVSGLAAGSYSVTVTSTAGCVDSSTFTITEPATGVAFPPAQADTVTCYGDSDGTITIDTAGLHGGTPPYLYSIDGVNFVPDSFFTGLASGYYQTYIQDSVGCIDSFEVYVATPEPIEIGLTTYYEEVPLGDSVRVDVELFFTPNNPPISYAWSPSYNINCDTCSSVYVYPYEDFAYIVTVTDQNGCQDTASVVINVDPNRHVFIPTAFTPNGDGLNDFFYLYGGLGVARVNKMMIFDRWGELLYQQENVPATDPAYGWDGRKGGKLMNPGAFVYYFEVEFVDGEVLTYKGDITMFRP